MTTLTTARLGDTSHNRHGGQQRAIRLLCGVTVSVGILFSALGVLGTGQSMSPGHDADRPVEASQPVAAPVPAPPPGS
jgi:hypothetical protein